MRKIFRMLPGGLLALGLIAAGCTGQSPLGADRVAPGYAAGGGVWGAGGGITAVVRVFRRDGATVVCGAWATDRQSVLTIHLNEDVMEAASVFIDGTRVAHGLRFMQRVAYVDGIAGAQASCVASTVAWRPGFAAAEPVLRFPRMVFPEDEDGAFGGGGTATFRQTARPSVMGEDASLG
jgi:hypothetical protein